MKSILQRLLLGGAALGLAAGASSAAVTLTETNYTTPPDQSTPVYVMENQWMRVVIGKGDTSYTVAGEAKTDSTARGTVIELNDKTGQVPTANQLSVPNNAADKPHVGNTGGYAAYRDRMSAKDPVWDGVQVTGTVDAGNTVATVTVEEDSGLPGFHIKKIYTLRDNQKWLQTDFTWTNNSGVDYAQTGTSSAVESIIYARVGGSWDPTDVSYAMMQANTAPGQEAVAGLNATGGNAWYGKGGTPLYPQLAQGWLAEVDPINTSALVTTWDLQKQLDASLTPGVAGVRAGAFTSGRFTYEILYDTISATKPLEFTLNLLVSNGLTSVSYAKEGELIAGIETKDKYNLESTVTATFKLNSYNPTTAVTYDIKNIRVEDRKTGDVVSGISMADITGVNVAANAVVTAGTRQFTPRSPGFTPGQGYVVKGDLYANGALLTTLSSRPFQVQAANAKVFLYQDSGGNYILENEVYQAVISANKGELNFFRLKDPATGEISRNQTVTSTPPYPMFRDFLQQTNAQAGFDGYTATLNPDGTDTDNSKSIRFDAFSTDGYSVYAKTYRLDSLSRSLGVHMNLQIFGDLGGGGFYSEVPMAPGGTSGSSDQFSAHTADGLLLTHPDPNGLKTTEYWMGAKNDNGNIVAGDQPELDQPWMAMRDNGTGDALAISWDLAKQKQYSGLVNGQKVTMNSLYIRNDYNQIPRVHFTNIPMTDTLDTTMYLMCDTGFRIVSYAEANRVLAGLWPNAGNNPAGAAFAGTAALTNTSTTAKTFDLKNIRIVKDTGESTPAGPDITGIAVDPAAQARPAITFTIPSGQAEGSYTLAADLYDGGTKVTTLLSPAFNVTAAVPGATGDVDNNGKVDADDVKLALKIAGGVVAADSGNITRGDMNGDGKITVEDAVAIAQKANAPS